MSTPQIVIKKYGNRRLYDSSRSRYVNLTDIAAMVRKGYEVQVIDATTGEDLTRGILMQIIVEDNKEGPAGLPLEVLRQLIVASDHVGREFLTWYLKSAFDAYGKVQQSFSSGLSELQTAATSPVQTIRNLFRTAPEHSEPQESELESLRRRLAELESTLKKKPAPRAKKPARKHSRPKKRAR